MMSDKLTAGGRFRQAIAEEKPLQVMGTMNAYAAMMATRVGYRAIYLSGAGVANYSYGLPDLGITSLDDVLTDVRRVTAAVDTPLLVDIDTGWGGAFNISRTIKEMIKAGAAAVHRAGAAVLGGVLGPFVGLLDRGVACGRTGLGAHAAAPSVRNWLSTISAYVGQLATSASCVTGMTSSGTLADATATGAPVWASSACARAVPASPSSTAAARAAVPPLARRPTMEWLSRMAYLLVPEI